MQNSYNRIQPNTFFTYICVFLIILWIVNFIFVYIKLIQEMDILNKTFLVFLIVLFFLVLVYLIIKLFTYSPLVIEEKKIYWPITFFNRKILRKKIVFTFDDIITIKPIFSSMSPPLRMKTSNTNRLISIKYTQLLLQNSKKMKISNKILNIQKILYYHMQDEYYTKYRIYPHISFSDLLKKYKKDSFNYKSPKKMNIEEESEFRNDIIALFIYKLIVNEKKTKVLNTLHPKVLDYINHFQLCSSIS